jgi:hypothetical protein
MTAKMLPAPNLKVVREFSSPGQQSPLLLPLQHQLPSLHCFTASLPARVSMQFFGHPSLSLHFFDVQE